VGDGLQILDVRPPTTTIDASATYIDRSGSRHAMTSPTSKGWPSPRSGVGWLTDSIGGFHKRRGGGAHLRVDEAGVNPDVVGTQRTGERLGHKTTPLLLVQ
jgi:hypothetical protein